MHANHNIINNKTASIIIIIVVITDIYIVLCPATFMQKARALGT